MKARDVAVAHLGGDRGDGCVRAEDQRGPPSHPSGLDVWRTLIAPSPRYALQLTFGRVRGASDVGERESVRYMRVDALGRRTWVCLAEPDTSFMKEIKEEQ